MPNHETRRSGPLPYVRCLRLRSEASIQDTTPERDVSAGGLEEVARKREASLRNLFATKTAFVPCLASFV